MPTRGTTIKHETSSKLTLRRPMITRRYVHTADLAKCCGCQLCVAVCPHQAMSLSAVQLLEGRITKPPLVDIDASKCCFCGECGVVCPTHVLSITVNERPEIPSVKGEAFPLLIRSNRVNPSACSASLETAYIDNCPVGAIGATIERDGQGQVTAVRDVAVDREKCIACTRCMELGPRGGFTVTKPYRGRAFLNTALCPPGCQACVDVCPTRTITYDGSQVALDQRFCLFCGACENVCPAKGAVRIVRSGLVHTPITSAAWQAAVQKLVSFREAARELDVKGQERRRKLVLGGLLLEKAPEGEKPVV